MPFQAGHPGYTPHLSEEHKANISRAHKGRTMSQETKDKIRAAKLSSPTRYWLGRKHSTNTRKKIALARALQVISPATRDKLRANMTGERNHNWKGGQPRCQDCGKKVSYNSKNRLCIRCFGKRHRGPNASRWNGGVSQLNVAIRKSEVYRRWRKAVFERDNFTCQLCGHRNQPGHRRNLNADHIKPFSQFPELRFRLDNGRTLCVSCHRQTTTYGIKSPKHD